MPALRNSLYDHDHFSLRISTCMSLFYNSFQLLKTAELFFLHSARLSHDVIGDFTAAYIEGVDGEKAWNGGQCQ